MREPIQRGIVRRNPTSLALRNAGSFASLSGGIFYAEHLGAVHAPDALFFAER